MNNPRVMVIGAVCSTAHTLAGLVRHGFDVVGVLGHEPKDRDRVSGWSDLRALAGEHGLEFEGFTKINQPEHLEWARARRPDIIFAVGFSQLMAPEWLALPTLGCVGFHPTCLPRGRGRAPMAWIILEERRGASTFFLMGEGADDGPIFVQQPFEVGDSDDACSIEDKICHTIDVALDDWLPRLREGEWNPVPQDELQATWFGKRAPEDGLIDWQRSAVEIDRLIKATTAPYPCAFTFCDGRQLKILESAVETDIQIRGVVGRVLLTDRERGSLVQCGDGLVWLRRFQSDDEVKIPVGKKLGLNAELEIFRLIQRLNENGK